MANTVYIDFKGRGIAGMLQEIENAVTAGQKMVDNADFSPNIDSASTKKQFDMLFKYIKKELTSLKDIDPNIDTKKLQSIIATIDGLSDRSQDA